MMQWGQVKLAKNGLLLFDKILNGTAKDINFNRAVLSTHEYDESDLEDIEEIEDIVCDGTILGKEIRENNILEIKTRFTNESISEISYIKTYGLYANFTPIIIDDDGNTTDGESETVLYAICKENSGLGVMLPFDNQSISELIMNINVKVGNALAINITLTPSSLASREYIDESVSELKEWVRVNGAVNMKIVGTNNLEIKLIKVYVIPQASVNTITLGVGESLETY